MIIVNNYCNVIISDALNKCRSVISRPGGPYCDAGSLRPMFISKPYFSELLLSRPY